MPKILRFPEQINMFKWFPVIHVMWKTYGEKIDKSCWFIGVQSKRFGVVVFLHWSQDVGLFDLCIRQELQVSPSIMV